MLHTRENHGKFYFWTFSVTKNKRWASECRWWYYCIAIFNPLYMKGENATFSVYLINLTVKQKLEIDDNFVFQGQPSPAVLSIVVVMFIEYAIFHTQSHFSADGSSIVEYSRELVPLFFSHWPVKRNGGGGNNRWNKFRFERAILLPFHSIPFLSFFLSLITFISRSVVWRVT